MSTAIRTLSIIHPLIVLSLPSARHGRISEVGTKLWEVRKLPRALSLDDRSLRAPNVITWVMISRNALSNHILLGLMEVSSIPRDCSL